MRYILLSILLIPFCVYSQANVRDLAHAKDAEISKTYSLNMNGTNVVVEKFKDFDYAHVEMQKTAQVLVSCEAGIKNYTISPLNKKIKGSVKDKQLSFTLPEAGYYVVSVNDGRKLFILADAPIKTPTKATGKDILNVKNYVSDNTGVVLQTKQLQKALDDASGSGKTLYFPAGIYRTGTLTIGSNTNIYLEAGAMIKGSENRNDYPTDNNKAESDHINNREKATDNGEFMTFSRLIYINDAENVHISGRGIIDGSGSIVRAQGKPANLIRVCNSKNVTIEGVVLRDPAAWNTHILYSKNVIIRNVKILNDFDVANTDGIDPDASQNVLVENCFAYCNDDNIAIKTTNNGNHLQKLENIRIKGCVFITKKSSLKVGTETKADLMQNILFENNDVIEADRGIVLYCNDGATFKDVRFVNNRFEKAFEKGQQRAIHFLIKDRYGKGKIENVLIKNCIFYQAYPNSSQLFGLDADHLINKVKIENLVIAGKKIHSLKEADIETNEFVKDIEIK